MDSLRYWISEKHVDGFRFDLASTLARGLLDVAWFLGDGNFIDEQKWNSEQQGCLGIFLHGEGIKATD